MSDSPAPLWPDHIAGHTSHARRGGIRNAFRYGVDYVLIDPLSEARPGLFSRNGFNLSSVNDRNHGGAPGAGRGLPWAQEVFAGAGLELDTADVYGFDWGGTGFGQVEEILGGAFEAVRSMAGGQVNLPECVDLPPGVEMPAGSPIPACAD